MIYLKDLPELIKVFEKGIRMAEAVDSGWVHVTIEEAKAALSRLKVQEPARAVKEFPTGRGDGSWWYICGNCLNPVNYHDVHCRYCGKELKWDD